MVLLPDEGTRPADSGNAVKIFAENYNVLGLVNVNVSCAGGSVSNSGTTLVEVTLAQGESCPLVVQATLEGNVVQYSATLSRPDAEDYTMSAGTATGGSFGGTPDVTAPRLDTIAAAQTYTNLDSLSFRATFDEAVANVTADDFAIGGTTATVTNIVVNSSSDYSLTVSGGDLADIADTTVTIALSGSQDIADTAGNALTDTSPTGYIDSVFVNNTPPVGTFSSAAVAPVSQPFTVNLAFTPQAGFADNILALTQSDIVVGNGTIESFTLTTGGGGVTTGADIVVRPIADGAVTLDLPENSVFDEAENQNPAATQFSINADVTVPTINIFKPGAPCPCDGPITVTISLSEGGITGFDINDLVVTGGTLSNFSFVNSGSVTLTPTADGTMTLQIPAGSMTDPDGFGNLESNLFSADFDTTRPTVTLTTAAVAPVTGEFDLDITFSEPLTNVGNTGVWTLTNGSRLSVTGSGANYVMRVRPQSGTQGTLTLDLAENGFSDAAGNGVVAPAQFSIAYDAANPRIASIERFSPTIERASNDLVRWRVTFDEAVSNVTADDFTVTGTTGTLSVSNTTTTTVDLDLSGGDMAGLDGTVTLGVAGAQNITDTAGNAMTSTAPTGTNDNTFVMDNTPPRVASVVRQSSTNAFTNADSITWRVTFNEDVTGIDATKFGLTVPFDVNNGTITLSVAQISASIFDVTASGGDLIAMNGDVSLRIFTTVNDVAFNTMADATPTGTSELTYTVDNLPIDISGIFRFTPMSEKTNADTLIWVAAADLSSATEAGIDATTVSAGDFALTGPTGATLGVSVENDFVDGSARITVTASGGDLASFTGTATLGMAAGSSILDLAGNTVTTSLAQAVESFDIRNTAPLLASITRSSPTSSLTNANTLVWRFTFAQIDDNFSLPANAFTVTGTTATVTSVSRFSIGFDVEVSGGDLADLNGDVTIGLANTDFVDDYGNVMDRTIPAGAELTYTLDNAAPSGHTVSINPAPINAANQTAIGVDFAGFEPGGSLTYTVTSDGGPGSLSGGFAVPLANGSFPPQDASTVPDGLTTLTVIHVDAVGNAAPAITATALKDTVVPTLAITGPTGLVSGAFTATFTFAEGVTGFDVGDIAVGNGAASNVQAVIAAGDGVTGPSSIPIASTYTATITPSADGAVTVDVTAAAAQDAAGNGNTAAAQFAVTNDATAPTAIVVDYVQPGTSPTNGDIVIWAITMSESLSNLDTSDIAVSGTTATITEITNPQPNLYAFTASGGDLAGLNGTITIELAPGNDVTDAAGNALASLIATGGTDERSVAIDNAAPTLSASGPAGPVSGAFDVTVTASEVIPDSSLVMTNLFQITNGTHDGSWTWGNPGQTEINFTITPTAEGTVTLEFGAGAIQDSAGNVNAATSGLYTVQVDQTAPQIASIVRQTPSVSPTDADTLTWRVTFDEAVSGVDAADFSIAGTTATLAVAPLASGAQESGTGAPLAATESVYDVTASGGDLVNLNATVTLSALTSGGITDVAGNAFANATPTGANESAWSVINDATAPTVASITRSNPTTENTNADSLVWLVSFSENVTDIGTGDFAVSGTTGTVTDVSPQAVSAASPSVAGDDVSRPFVVSSSAFVVTASGGDLASFNGAVVLSFAQGQDITDGAGNALTNTTPTGANENSYTLDNTAPTVTLTTTATAPVSGPFTLTATFSEDVTGFDVSDLSVGNGTASNFAATSATIYTATITPGAGTSTTVDVASAAAIDAVGNDSTAASQFSITHDPDRTLSVSLPGVGSGTVTSAPTGISCGADCTEDYAVGTSVTLTAAADTGSTFAGWTAGPCIGTSTASCAITMSADTSVSARFTLDTPPAGRIVAATLPGARSGYVGGPVMSAFLSVVSRTSSPAQSCQITAPAGAPVTLMYRQLDSAGKPIGPESPLFDIDPGGARSFVIAMTPTAQTGPDGYSFLPVITCQNASLDPIIGVNDVLLNIGPNPTPDFLSISATPSGDGVIRIASPGGLQFMTASVINIGVGDGSAGANEVTLTTTIDTGAASLPLNLEICQINASAICISPRGPSVTSTMAQNTPTFFAAFVRDTSTGGIAFDPANSRVFLRFADAGGTIRSATSAAVTAPAPTDAPEIASSLPTGRWSVLMRQPDDGQNPSLVRTTLYVLDDGSMLVDDGQSVRLTSLAPVTAANDSDSMHGYFAAQGYDGLWTSTGSIRLGAPWAEQVGEFWGVRDTRSEAATHWSDLAGAFGGTIQLSETGEIRGNVEGCAIYGQARGIATHAVSLSLSGCPQSGAYLGQMDLPANDNDNPALLIANGERGWRAGR